MSRVRAWRRRLVVSLALGAAMTIAAVHAQAAFAQAPVRAGWWNTVSAPGLAAPAPTTPAGGLRVSAAPGQVLAFGAVLYRVPLGAAAKLTLKIAGAQGTPQVEACPTKDAAWKAGDDQPADTAPVYDCGTQHYPGKVSSDGTKITFKVEALTESKPGRLSLAIVPDLSGSDGSSTPGVNTPFFLDLNKPTSKSLVVTSSAPSPSKGRTPPNPPSQPVQAPAPAPGPASQPVQAPPPAPVTVPGAPLAVPSFRGNPTRQGQTGAARSSGPASQVVPGSAPVAATALPTQGHGIRMTAASVIGGVALVVALVLWGLGYGLLGGRVIPLSEPLPRDGAPARRTPRPPAGPSLVRAPTGHLLR